jgi:hypothetical protein
MERRINEPMDPAVITAMKDLGKFPYAVEFGNHLKQRMDLVEGDITPEVFFGHGLMLINDLRRGRDGFSGEVLRTGLEELPEVAYGGFVRSLPYLARVILDQERADKVSDLFSAYESRERESS